jgi:hypothetical protein
MELRCPITIVRSGSNQKKLGDATLAFAEEGTGQLPIVVSFGWIVGNP